MEFKLYHDTKKKRFATLSMLLITILVVACGKDQSQDSTLSKFPPQITHPTDALTEQNVGLKDQGLCELAEVGGPYIIGYLGIHSISVYTAQKVVEKAEEIVKNAPEASDFKNTVTGMVGVKDPNIVANRTREFLESGHGRRFTNFFRTIPYLEPLFGLFNLIRGFGTIECNPSLAIKKFVTDNIIRAHNQNLQRIWANAAQDARDELKDIEIANENLLTGLEILVNTFNYVKNEKAQHSLISRDMEFTFKQKFTPVISSVVAFSQRIQSDVDAKWTVSSAAAYAKLIQLSLHLMKAHLVAANGVDTEHLDDFDPIQSAALKGASGHGYQAYHKLTALLEQHADDMFKKLSSPDRFTLEFKCDQPCYRLDDYNWKVRLFGSFVLKLYGNEVITFPRTSGYEIDLINLVNYFPEDVQHAIPQRKPQFCGGIRGTPRCRPLNLDEDKSWPGKTIVIDTGLRGRGGAKITKTEYHPYNKYLGLGRDGFWNYVLNDLTIHTKHASDHDPEIAPMIQELQQIFQQGESEFQAVLQTLNDVRKNLENCSSDDDYESLRECLYFSDPVMDAIRETVREFDEDSSGNKLNLSLN